MMDIKDYHSLMDNLLNRDEEEIRTELRKRRINDILKYYGFPAHFKGYNFLCDAIIIAVCNEDDLCSITKYIYPEIARTYNTNAYCVDSNIRHAISFAWEFGNLRVSNEFAIKPTNSMLVFTIANNIK